MDNSMVALSEDMSVSDVGNWLNYHGFCEEVQECFTSQEMDGEALFGAFGSQAGPDCFKDVLPKFGQRIKVYKAIKAEMERIDQSLQGDSTTSVQSMPNSSSRETLILSRESSPGSPTSSVTSSHSKVFVPKGYKSLPDPFPIPIFRPCTEKNLEQKDLYPDDRRYMVRVLATMVLSHVAKASVHDCEQVGKALIQKSPFLKEYHSWAQFIYTRCQNCNRKPPSTANEPKAKKKKNLDNHCYSTLVGEPEDEETHKRNMELLETEWTKFSKDKRCSADRIKELMSRTFLHRREGIRHSERPVSEIVKEYRCLSRLVFVAHEMSMICQCEEIIDQFEEKWKSFVGVIISYSKAIPFQTKELKLILDELGDDYKASTDNPTEVDHMIALKCLASFLVTKRKKQDKNDHYTVVPFFLIDVPNSTPERDFADSCSTHPLIVRRFDADDSIPPTYSIYVEGKDTIKCADIISALFVVFAYHYIFNISYHPKLNDLYTFMQEKIFGIPGDQKRKSPNLSSFMVAIAATIKD